MVMVIWNISITISTTAPNIDGITLISITRVVWIHITEECMSGIFRRVYDLLYSHHHLSRKYIDRKSISLMVIAKLYILHIDAIIKSETQIIRYC